MSTHWCSNLADQQTLRKAPKPLVTPVVPLKACWLNRTEMSCYFSHLSAETDRGEFDESLIPRFPPLLGVGTVDIWWNLDSRVPTITWCGNSGHIRNLDSKVPTITWCGDSGHIRNLDSRVPTITWCGDSGHILNLDSRVPTITWCGDSGYMTNPWFQGSHHYLVWGQWIHDESLIPGFPPLLGVGTVDICCEQPTRIGRDA